jgi:hypothetical protein
MSVYRFARLKAGVLGSAMLVSTPAPVRPAADFTVSSLIELDAVLRDNVGTGGGKIIDVMPGSYAGWSPAPRDYASNVIIRPQNLLNRPVFKAIANTDGGTHGLTLQDLVVYDPTLAFAFSCLIEIHGCHRWSFEGLKLRGPAGSARIGRGIKTQGCNNVNVQHCDVQSLSDGLVFNGPNGNSKSTGLTVKRNSIRDVESDGIDFYAFDTVDISENYISGFHPVVGDHSDAIQGFQLTGGGVSDTVANSNMDIKRNLIVARYDPTAAGIGRCQGIFVNPGSNDPSNGGVPVYQGRGNFEDNILIGTNLHGITLDYFTDGVLTVKNNALYDVDDFGDSITAPGIELAHALNVVSSGNSAPRIVIDGTASYASGSNTGNTQTGSAKLTRPQADALVASWAATYSDVPYATAY